MSPKYQKTHSRGVFSLPKCFSWAANVILNHFFCFFCILLTSDKHETSSVNVIFSGGLCERQGEFQLRGQTINKTHVTPSFTPEPSAYVSLKLVPRGTDDLTVVLRLDVCCERREESPGPRWGCRWFLGASFDVCRARLLRVAGAASWRWSENDSPSDLCHFAPSARFHPVN